MEKFIAYKKNGQFDKTQGFIHESVFVSSSDEEALSNFAKDGYETVIIDATQANTINSILTIDELKNNLINVRKKYIASTDWEAAAFIKRQRAVSQITIDKNNLAITQINEINKIVTLPELQKYELDFE